MGIGLPIGLRLGRLRLAVPVPERDVRAAPAALVEQRLQHHAEVLAALCAQLVREPLDCGGAAPGHLLRYDVIYAREGLIGHAPAERKGEQLPLPRIQALERAGKLFGRDHGAVT